MSLLPLQRRLGLPCYDPTANQTDFDLRLK
jgi:hypothetical protein